MGRETPLLKRILIEATEWGARLFRNDTGQAYVGRLVEKYDSSDGRVVTLAGAKRIRYGLAKGSSDLIGWRPVHVTPDMVGRTLGLIVVVEAKTKNDRLSREQRNWLEQVSEAGGEAFVVRERDDGIEWREYEV